VKHLHVAAGILRNSAGRVLITERLCDGPLNGLWEFPGGKIANGETPGEALRRELAEELGVRVTHAEPFLNLRHEYTDRCVNLEFFVVSTWQGEPCGIEGQQLRWIAIADLDPGMLLPADAAVIAALRCLEAESTASH